MATRTAPPKSPPRRSAPAAASGPATEPDPFDLSRPSQAQQPELPMTVAPAAGEVDEVRQSLSVISTHLAKFDEASTLLPELEKKYKNVVYAVDTAQGMTDAKAARKAIKDPRVAVENARVAAKAPLLKLGRDIEAQANAIKNRLSAIETPIDQQITAQETKEAERKAALEKRVREVQGTPSMCIGKTSAQLQEVLDGIVSLPLEEFAEFRPQAAAAQESARQQVALLLQQAKQADELAELKRKQDEAETRRAGLQSRVDAIGDALTLPYKTSERVQQAIDRVTSMPIGEDFAEFAPAAREKKVAVIGQLVALRDEKKRAEDAAAAAAAPRLVKDAGSYNGSSIDAIVTGGGLSAGQLQHGTVDGLAPDAARIYPDEPRQTYVSSAPLVSTVVPGIGRRYLPGVEPTGKLDDQSRTVDIAQGSRMALHGEGGPSDIVGLSDHDRINEDGAQRLHSAFGPDVDPGQPVRRTGGGIPRFQSIDPDAVEKTLREPPSDAELLMMVAEHYDVPDYVANAWLIAFARRH